MTAVLAETARKLVAQEPETLFFPKRNALTEGKGEGKNGTYPRPLEIPHGRVKLHVPRTERRAFG